MLRRLTLILTLTALVGLIAAPAVSAAPPSAGVEQAVTGTLNGTTPFSGTLTIDRIAKQGGELVALGSLTGTGLAAPVDVALPVQVAQATCDILTLVLGPLHLDLLGLVIDLNQVELNITAEQGPGNLLGNLLCAVAGLLDPTPTGGILNGIAQLLNQILGILGSLGV